MIWNYIIFFFHILYEKHDTNCRNVEHIKMTKYIYKTWSKIQEETVQINHQTVAVKGYRFCNLGTVLRKFYEYLNKNFLLRKGKLCACFFSFSRRQTKSFYNGILFWPTVRKNCSSDREKRLKFEAEGREFAKILRSQSNLFKQ